MVKRIARIATLAAATAVAGAACEPEPGPSLGKYVHFIFEHEERTLCAGTVEHLDRYVERVFEFFEASPEGFHVPIYVVEDSSCSASACYYFQAVYIETLDFPGKRVSGTLRHEISHAVVDSILGPGVSFFAEGVAEAFSGTRTWLVDDAVVPVGALLDEDKDLDYTAAARFVRFLIDTRGLERFKQIYRKATKQSQPAIRAAFEAVYGETFEAIEAEYLSGAPRCQYQLDLCDPATVEPLGSAWSVELAASCLDPDFYGSDGDDGVRMVSQRTVEVEVSGRYRLRTSHEPQDSPGGESFLSSEVRITRCGACEEQFTHVLRVEAELDLEPGIYALEFLPANDSVLWFEIELVDKAP